MCENVYERLELTIEDYSRIANEVWDLVGVQDALQALSAYRHLDQYDTSLLNAKLQELLDDVKNHPSDELVAWIRYSNNWRKSCPAWQPLLDAAVAQAFTRNEKKTVEDMFLGLIPGSKMYDYNRRDES